MTTGAVIFAVGKYAIDYAAMASWSAARIERHLGLPTTLITDQAVENSAFDHIIRIDTRQSDRSRWFADFEQSVPWHNLDRCDALDLSPYDRTLLLDADYVVSSSLLHWCATVNERFWCFEYAVAAGGSHSWDTFGRHAHPQYWATVMAFSRDNQAEFIFDSMRMVRDNWQHYRDLYHIDSALFRNDYALSISLPLVNGHVHPDLPMSGAMINVLPEHHLEQIDHDTFDVVFGTVDRRRRCTLHQQDFHAMCKRNLGAIVAAH